MESCSQTSHLISHLPEIISKMMEFLPTTDVESASLVNATWEMEALKQLMVRNPVEIQLKSDVNDSVDLVTLSNLSPTCLKIVSCASVHWEDLLSKIELLSPLNFKTVTKLNIELPLDTTLRHVASRLVKICESFKNLTSLEFQPTLYDWDAMFSSLHDWKDLLPDNFSPPPNLIALNFNMFRFYPDCGDGRWNTVIALATRILTVFSRIKNLSLTDVPCGVLEKDGIILPHLVSLSLTITFHLSQHHDFLEYFKFSSITKESFANVTRLEFNVIINDAITNGFELLYILAPQLEHVCISGLENVIPRKKIYTSQYIMIPILPKLKVFEILRQKKISIFFISLESVSFWSTSYCKKPHENLHFDATMLFLYETFLAEGLEPCETLRNLDISFPTGPSWNLRRLRMKRRCGCDDEIEICKCWGWKEDFPDFYGRISTIFPNLNYDVVEMGKMNMRVEKIKKIQELGASLVVFHDKGRLFKEFDEILDLEKE